MFKGLIKKALQPKNKKTDHHQEEQKNVVDPNLEAVIAEFTRRFGDTSDLVLRKLLIGSTGKPALVVYFENMVDLKVVNEGIIAKLQEAPAQLLSDVKVMAHSVLSVAKVTITNDLEQVIDEILYGKTAVFMAGASQAVIAGTVGWETRSIQSPQTEVNMEGPREAFVESKNINLTMIRRRLRDSSLRFEDITVGVRTRTSISVCYIQGLADPGIVAEVKKRLKAIDIDGVIAMQTLAGFLKDQPLSPFPTVGKTERPENVVASLLEGRVAVIADGYPFVLLAPTTFVQFLQAGDDYYTTFYYGTFLRWLRIFAYIVTLTLPSLYVAIITHHWEMIPTDLALSIAGAREGVPFPALFEALAMEFTFEVLREAGVRLPRAVGQAVSIVGALVIGQAAVQAGLVSPSIVIIVAFTGITSFAIPYNQASIPFRLLRFPLMLISSQVGLPGLVAGVMVIWGHMTSLTSFGVPYLMPFMPFQGKDMKDSLFRFPRWAMVYRPQSVPSLDPKRLGNDHIPPEGEA